MPYGIAHSAIEFRDRECHRIEYAAGIVVGGRDALLIGTHIFGRGYHKLTRADYSDDREYSHRNSQESSSVIIVVIAEAAVKTRYHGLGNVASAAATAAMVVSALKHVHTEDNRLDGIYNRPLIGMLYAIIKSEKFRR